MKKVCYYVNDKCVLKSVNSAHEIDKEAYGIWVDNCCYDSVTDLVSAIKRMEQAKILSKKYTPNQTDIFMVFHVDIFPIEVVYRYIKGLDIYMDSDGAIFACVNNYISFNLTRKEIVDIFCDWVKRYV